MTITYLHTYIECPFSGQVEPAPPQKGFIFLTGSPSVERAWAPVELGEDSGYSAWLVDHPWTGSPGQTLLLGRETASPSPCSCGGTERGRGGRRREVAANTFQKMSSNCLPGPRPNRLPMALKNISANWQQHFRTWVVLSFKKDNGG